MNTPGNTEDSIVELGANVVSSVSLDGGVVVVTYEGVVVLGGGGKVVELFQSSRHIL